MLSLVKEIHPGRKLQVGRPRSGEKKLSRMNETLLVRKHML
jgi:hypothetical protein